MERREEEEEEENEDRERGIESKESESSDDDKFLELTIPLDLIQDILLRLPAKSAARFRCVSKLWSFITTRPYFISSFVTQASTHRRLCLRVGARDKSIFVSLPQYPDKSCSHHVDCRKMNFSNFEYQQEWSESVHGLMDTIRSMISLNYCASHGIDTKSLLFLHWDLEKNHGERPKTALHIFPLDEKVYVSMGMCIIELRYIFKVKKGEVKIRKES
ncbi:putative F-box protein At4g21240 [Eutrema salsugineum]|uniref:putative F-box protein At4g21240 n=1 Tax=Eutrema salsugineum TaxID=72664 RepID=UPI000CED258F|nr:putative F-box protein At4g21240 [Eutrema salsugineum]